MVVAFHLERDGPALADVDDTGVLAHADEEAFLHLVVDLLAELTQVDLRRLVGAVLRPHHRVHGELAGSGATAEDLTDLLVLVGLQTESTERLLLIGCGYRVGDGIGAGANCGEISHARGAPLMRDRNRPGGPETCTPQSTPFSTAAQLPRLRIPTASSADSAVAILSPTGKTVHMSEPNSSCPQVPGDQDAGGAQQPGVRKLSTFLKVSIILLAGLTVASISLLFIGDFEGKFERVFSTFVLFAVFVLLTALDTRREQKSEWYAPVALIANSYILA